MSVRAPIGTADLLGPEIPAALAAPFFCALIDPAVGVIRAVRQRNDWPHDEPKTVMYRAELMPTAAFSSGGYKTPPAEAGRSLDHDVAASAALFEAVERYCLSIYDAGSLTTASHRELDLAGVTALDPALLSDPRSALSTDKVNLCRLAWISATSLLDGSVHLVPAQLVYLPYEFPEGEPVLRDPLTTGCAAGTSIGPAVLRGLLEVIERDATMIRHYRQLTPRRLDPGAFGSNELDSLVRDCERYCLEVELFDYSLDLPVPVIAARVRDRTGGGPATTVGSKAAFDAADAAVGAVLEAVTFRGPMRTRSKTARRVALSLFPDPQRVASSSDRAFLWVQPEMADYLGYLDNATKVEHDLPSTHRPEPAIEDVDALVRHIARLYGDILICDVTTPDIREMGAVVVKVLVVGLQPMHLSEPNRRWTTRLLTAGQSPADRMDEKDLNSLPHPFL